MPTSFWKASDTRFFWPAALRRSKGQIGSCQTQLLIYDAGATSPPLASMCHTVRCIVCLSMAFSESSCAAGMRSHRRSRCHRRGACVHLRRPPSPWVFDLQLFEESLGPLWQLKGIDTLQVGLEQRDV